MQPQHALISVSEANSRILDSVHPLKPTVMLLGDTVGFTLAADVYATTNIPAYPQSSMDGYAFAFDALKTSTEFVIDGEIAAGDNSQREMTEGNAVRIFTGAAVPIGADTVVMQEKVSTDNGKLIIKDPLLKQGSNVRPAGSEIKAGELALAAGNRITAAAIGFLAGIGKNEVEVYPSPVISIIVTGNELQTPGQPLQYGQVYESNSSMLTAALRARHFTKVKVDRVRDDLGELTKSLMEALISSDVVILVGGISVGDYDYVLKATNKCEVFPVFHKIRQRPGKPFFFGQKEFKPVFGLPGNPSSALTCFYLYILPALEKITGSSLTNRTSLVPLANEYKKDPGLTHFLKGHYDGKTVMPLHAQESYRLRSFAESNCLIEIDEDATECKKGTMVKVHHLPI